MEKSVEVRLSKSACKVIANMLTSDTVGTVLSAIDQHVTPACQDKVFKEIHNFVKEWKGVKV